MKKRQIIKFVAECANALGTGMVVGGLCAIGLGAAKGPAIAKAVLGPIAAASMAMVVEDKTKPYVDQCVDLVANSVEVMTLLFKKKEDSEEVQEA